MRVAQPSRRWLAWMDEPLGRPRSRSAAWPPAGPRARLLGDRTLPWTPRRAVGLRASPAIRHRRPPSWRPSRACSRGCRSAPPPLMFVDLGCRHADRTHGRARWRAGADPTLGRGADSARRTSRSWSGTACASPDRRARRPGPVQARRLPVRALVGVDPDTGTIAVGGRVEVGAVVQLHVRDRARGRGARAGRAARRSRSRHAVGRAPVLVRRPRRGAVRRRRPRQRAVRARDGAGADRRLLRQRRASSACSSAARSVHSQTSAFALFRRRAAEA